MTTAEPFRVLVRTLENPPFGAKTLPVEMQVLGAEVGDRLDVQHFAASLGSGPVRSGLAGLTGRW